MTVGKPVQSLGAREARENLRALGEDIADGKGPILILRDAQPMAVLIQHAEAERWQRIDRALWHLHGMRILPELAHGASEIEAIVRGQREPTTAQLEAIDVVHDIGHFVRPIGISAARQRFAEVLDEVGTGRPRTLVTGGRLVATLIRPMEYDRLMGLSRIVAWFKMHGLDLADTTDEASYAWLHDFRAGRRPDSADAEDTGSAIA
ncbi:MAG: type II toxin-antitoxin system Phd/YefM family antitoxin [Chloroflexota bacterium]|nr:type II toxin-antitoxin system Phd/YefM family antitoxin [Chloroflexota bacterium]